MILPSIYIVGLIALAIFMYYEDNNVFKFKMNWIFLVLYPLIMVYIVLTVILFALDGFLIRKPPNDIS